MTSADRMLARRGLAGCVALILYVTLQPFRFDQSPRFATVGLFHSVPDLVMNLVLFVPVGILGALSASRCPALFASLFGLSLSLIIEALQTMNRDRSASFGDLLTNTLGATLGGSSVMLAGWASTTALGRRFVRGLVSRPATVGLIGLLLIYVLMPYADAKRVEDGLYLSRHDLPSKFVRRVDFAELVLFIGVGRRLAIESTARRAIGVVLALDVGLELLQFPVSFGRFAPLPPILNALAGGIGCLSASLWPSGRALAAAFALALPLAGLVGDGIVGRGSRELFARLGPGEIVRLARVMALFLPLGIVFARSRRARWIGVLGVCATSWVLPFSSSASLVATAAFALAASLGARLGARGESSR